jgi:hypothetical protein
MVDDAFKGHRKKMFDVIAAVPVNQDLRMVMQQGAFTIHTRDVPLETMPGCQKWLRKIIIPAKDVRRFRNSLDVLGMRLSDVFPDLAHLAIDLMKMHPPRSGP